MGSVGKMNVTCMLNAIKYNFRMITGPNKSQHSFCRGTLEMSSSSLDKYDVFIIYGIYFIRRRQLHYACTMFGIFLGGCCIGFNYNNGVQTVFLTEGVVVDCTGQCLGVMRGVSPVWVEL